MAFFDFKEVVFSEAQRHRGWQGPLPTARGTGLIEEGDRGGSTRLKPTFSQQGNLWGLLGVLHCYLRPKAKGGQTQKHSQGPCPSCGPGEMPPRTMGTGGKRSGLGACLQGRKRGTQL